MRKVAGLALLAAALALPTAANANVRVLPSVERDLTAGAAEARDCFASIAEGRRGVDTTTYTAPISGFVTVKLAARSGDWDLALFDRATGRRVASSAGFGSREVAQTWIGAGEKLLIQGCRRNGDSDGADVTVDLADVQPPRVSGTPMLLRVAFDSNQDLERLAATGVDVTHHIHDGQADVIVQNADQAAQLTRLGFDYEVEIANLMDHYAKARAADAEFTRRVGVSSLPSGRTTYRVYADYGRELKELAEENPDIVRPVVLPNRSFQGREIQGVEIARDVNATDDGRPVYLLVAMHHAREWPSAESAMEFAHMAVQGYADGDPRIVRLMRDSRVIVVPLINPDGFISSRGAVDPTDLVSNQGQGNGTGQGVNPNLADLDENGGQDFYDCPPIISSEEECDTRMSLFTAIAPPGGVFSYRRKNCDGAVPDGRVPCELQWGVDPNRNYGQSWGGPGSSGEWMSQSYRGTGPWSEPETQNVHELSQRLQVTNIMTIHNVAALVLRPPSTSDGGQAPDETALAAIGDAMGEATGYESQFGFQLYDTSGTTEEWNYAQQGAFGYTIEIGPKNGEFHMPYETGFVKEWNGETAGNGKGLREAYMIAWEAAADPAHHSVIRGKAPGGRILRLRKSFDTVTKPTCRTEVGVSPLNTEGIYDLVEEISGVRPCLESIGPITVPDGLDTTLEVPANGRFEWHVTPSTRPFVGKDKEGVYPFLRSTTHNGSGEVGNPPPTLGETDLSDVEIDHVIDAGSEPARLYIELGWANGAEDYDMYVFRESDSGELEPVGRGRSSAPGTSASLGQPEYVTVDPQAGDTKLRPGRYVVRITNYLAGDNAWTLRIDEFGEPATVPGEREPWTLICERPNGDVLHTQEVFVDRGKAVDLNLRKGCRD